MFNLKTAVIGAAAGFAVSFIAGIIGRVDFLFVLLRALLSAAFSALLISGVRFLYLRFLDEEQNEAPSSAVKSSPTGSVVDITLDDAELPDTDSAPDFIVGNAIKNSYKEDGGGRTAKTGSEAATAAGAAEKESPSRSDAQTLPHEAVQDGFVPYSLGKAPAEDATSAESDTAELAPAEPSADAANGQAGVDASATVENEPDETAVGEDDTVLDTLPDLEGFTPQEQYADDSDGDFMLKNSSGDFQPRSMQGNASVDLSDAKNIASAIRTALNNET